MIGEGEALDEAAHRMLAEKTGIEGVYLEQLYTFGIPQRDPRGRVVSVAYYALLPYCRLRMTERAGNLAWHELGALPETLAFDHGEIVAMAKKRLCAKLEYSTIAFQLMPEKFTLSELHR